VYPDSLNTSDWFDVSFLFFVFTLFAFFVFHFFISLLFHLCFVSVFQLLWVSSLAYPNLLVIKRLGCCCRCYKFSCLLMNQFS
jgi:hypothetical protein